MTRELIYGRQPVLETLRAGRRQVFKVLVAEGTQTSAESMAALSKVAVQREAEVRMVALHDLDRLCGGGHHQGVAAEVGEYPYVEREELIEGAQGTLLLLMLDHIQDPQNLGAILRTAETAGVDGVIIPKDRAAAVTPAVVRASSGASEHLPIVRVVNLHQTIRWLHDQQVWIVGLEAVAEARLYTAADLTGPLCLVVGSEGAGLGRLVRESCDFLVRLPVQGRIGSLNASAAAAVALYEVLRQRGSQRRVGPSDIAPSP